MPVIVRAEVVLPFVTGLPRDVAVNVLHFTADGVDTVDEEDLETISLAAVSLYNEPVTGTGTGIDSGRVAGYLSPMINRAENACRVKCYDAQADPLVQLYEHPWTLHTSGSGETPLTNELAVTATLTCTPVTPVPIRRRRGRMFYGPLNGAVLGTRTEAGVTTYPAIKTAARDTIAWVHQHLAENLTAGYTWCVYSRVNDAAYAITGGWIDNDLDIQRRREVDPTVRTSWGTLA